MILRKFILFFILIAATSSLKAQGSYNFGRYAIGVYGSSTLAYADLKTYTSKKAITVAGFYNLTPYLPIGAEYQMGQLVGGSIITDPNKRQFDNHYKAFILHGDIGLGEIFDYEGDPFLTIVKDFYIGTGIGVISNNMAFIQRTNLIPSDGYPVGTYTFPGQDKSLNLIIPIRFGYEYKIYSSYDEPMLSICIGYIHNMTKGEGLDGYTDPSSGFKNNSPDQYRQIVVGLKFNFGPSTSYSKSIN